MSEPYVGEIRLFAGNFAPAGWNFCDGQLLSIAENDTLFFLIGTTYGGDGESTFALPDLRGRVPVHQGQGPGRSPWGMGQSQGTEAVTLTLAQMPAHTHQLHASTHVASSHHGPGDVLGASPGTTIYGTGTPSQPMAKDTVAKVSGGHAHSNMGPSLAVNYIISMFGIFPSQG
jgi:microcystin-dependent protein